MNDEPGVGASVRLGDGTVWTRTWAGFDGETRSWTELAPEVVA